MSAKRKIKIKQANRAKKKVAIEALKLSQRAIRNLSQPASRSSRVATPEEVAHILGKPTYINIVDARDMTQEETQQMLSIPHPVYTQHDPVNHPAHYRAGDIYETIRVIEAWNLNFRLGTCVKYISRADSKGQPIQDLEKARWYLDREIAKRKAAV